MKKFLIIFIVGISFLLFGYFLKAKNQDEIVFWTLQMGDYSDYINSVIREYEVKTNLKIKWVDVPFSEGEKRTLSAILSKNPPDLINLNPDFSILLAQKGALKYIPKGKLSDFTSDVVNSLIFDGQIYAIPWYATSAVTFYNKKYTNVFPTYFDDLPKLAQKIQDKKVFIYMPNITENDTMAKILNKYGVYSYEKINSDNAIAVFKMFKDMYDKGQIPKESVTQTQREALEKYMSGQVVYFQGGANFLNLVKENAPDIYNNTGISEQIKGSLGQNDFSLMNLVIPLKSKHPYEALDFALFLTNEKNQLELAKLTNIIATNKNVLTSDFYNRDGNLMQKAISISSKQLQNVNPVMHQSRNQKEINLLINTAVQEILINNADIKSTLDRVSEKWKDLQE